MESQKEGCNCNCTKRIRSVEYKAGEVKSNHLDSRKGRKELLLLILMRFSFVLSFLAIPFHYNSIHPLPQMSTPSLKASFWYQTARLPTSLHSTPPRIHVNRSIYIKQQEKSKVECKQTNANGGIGFLVSLKFLASLHYKTDERERNSTQHLHVQASLVSCDRSINQVFERKVLNRFSLPKLNDQTSKPKSRFPSLNNLADRSNEPVYDVESR